jgi:hypothetical protein
MLLFGIQIIPNNIKITAGARGGLRLFLVLYELSEVKLVCIALQRIACVSLFWQEILLCSGAKTSSTA